MWGKHIGYASEVETWRRPGPAPPGHQSGTTPPTMLKPPIGVIPISIGRDVLGPYSFDNPAHPGAQVKVWADGPGLGVPFLYFNPPWCVAAFGLHAEQKAIDFLNRPLAEIDPQNFQNFGDQKIPFCILSNRSGITERAMTKIFNKSYG